MSGVLIYPISSTSLPPPMGLPLVSLGGALPPVPTGLGGLAAFLGWSFPDVLSRFLTTLLVAFEPLDEAAEDFLEDLALAAAAPATAAPVFAGAAVLGAAVAAAGAAPPTLITCGVALPDAVSPEPRPPISTPTPSASSRQA